METKRAPQAEFISADPRIEELKNLLELYEFETKVVRQMLELIREALAKDEKYAEQTAMLDRILRHEAGRVTPKCPQCQRHKISAFR